MYATFVAFIIIPCMLLFVKRDFRTFADLFGFSILVLSIVFRKIVSGKMKFCAGSPARGLLSPAWGPRSMSRRRRQGCRVSGIHRSDRLRSRRPLTAVAGYSERFDVAYRDIYEGCTALLDAVLKQDKQWNEAILHRMDLMGISISTGSACDSVNTEISHVLKAIHLDENYAKGTIRISLGKNNTDTDIDKIATALSKILH